MIQKSFYKPAIACAFCLGLAACDDATTLTSNANTVLGAGDTVLDTTTTDASIRVIHASPDAPAVDVLLNGATAVSALDYAQSTGFTPLDAGTYDIAVDGLLPGATATVIEVDGLELAAGSRTTVVAVGALADIAPIVVADSTAIPASEEVSLTVTHAAPDVPAVSVYLLAATDVFDASQPGTALQYQQTLDLGALGAAEVRIVAALNGAIAYDSGVVDLAPFAGQQLSVFAIASESVAESTASPIKLLIGTGEQTVVLQDTDTQSAARVVHLSPDARAVAHGPVEVFATASGHPIELIDAFFYTDVVPAADAYVAVPADTYRFDVAPDTDTIGDTVYSSPHLTLEAGADYSVVAVGRVSNTDPLNAFRLLAFEDDNRPVATQASLRVVHGAPAAGTVDVYLTPAGQVDAHAITTVEPTLSDFQFADATDALAIAAGHYDIRVVAGGAVAINVEGVELAPGSVTTAIARGPIEGVHVAPQDFGLVVLSR